MRGQREKFFQADRRLFFLRRSATRCGENRAIDDPTGANKRQMEYEGQAIDPDFQIERVKLDELDPEQFYSRFVVKRRPVVLEGTIEGWEPEKWTLERLMRMSVEKEVIVERRSAGDRAFGTDTPRVKMPWSEFIARMGNKDEEESDYYLSTQYEDNDDEVDEFCSFPLSCFLDQVPARPSILGSLVPNRMNMWMGKSRVGTSSGLHHDFDDNLYILLKGEKKFCLFSPIDAYKMNTYGTIKRVHPNGLINYEGCEETRSDGITLSEVTALLSMSKQPCPTAPSSSDLSASDVTADDSCGEQSDCLSCSFDMSSFKDDFDDYVDMSADSLSREADDGSEEPLHFCKLPSSYFVNSRSSSPPHRVLELHQGDALYLPAGWFHEVTSCGTHDSSDHVHLAVNYWLYPPTTTATFESPYQDDLCRQVWTRKLQSARARNPSAAPSDPVPV
ncbi:uncharacterized protein LOC126320545 [Schistocerca gregaria]|uniref:uncharacterized protein LOC126320545 n=1 Tax=Schistocerca gregaria TaxID=7010 RepID=UPI00211ECB42|nr:uncharacterized protein LOC126320545 [Schistocerca gregaria]